MKCVKMLFQNGVLTAIDVMDFISNIDGDVVSTLAFPYGEGGDSFLLELPTVSSAVIVAILYVYIFLILKTPKYTY